MHDRENEMRQPKYHKPEQIEKSLIWMNDLLSGVDAPSFARQAPVLPCLLLVGLPRTGTTLLMQLLAGHCVATYPDNIVARFWEAPHVGIVVSRSLKAQVGTAVEAHFSSDYGVAEGVFGPHEFGNFWKKWFRFEPTHERTADELSKVDRSGITAALGLMEQFGGAPLVFKVVPLSCNIQFLASLLPNSRFVWIDRDPLFVGQSILQARLNRYGGLEPWWSIKPRQWHWLRELPPAVQVAGQSTIRPSESSQGWRRFRGTAGLVYAMRTSAKTRIMPSSAADRSWEIRCGPRRNAASPLASYAGTVCASMRDFSAISGKRPRGS